MRYLSTTEAAAVLSIDPSRVRLLCKLGRIKTTRVGNTYGIAEGELRRFAALRRPPGRPRKNALQIACEVAMAHVSSCHNALGESGARKADFTKP
jgi:excisionase family DNA binding protein